MLLTGAAPALEAKGYAVSVFLAISGKTRLVLLPSVLELGHFNNNVTLILRVTAWAYKPS